MSLLCLCGGFVAYRSVSVAVLYTGIAMQNVCGR